MVEAMVEGVERKMEGGVETESAEAENLESAGEGGAVEGGTVDARVVNEEAETSLVETTETYGEEERRPPVSVSPPGALSSQLERQELWSSPLCSFWRLSRLHCPLWT